MDMTVWNTSSTLKHNFDSEQNYLKKCAERLRNDLIVLIEGAHSEENLVYKDSAPDEERGIISIDKALKRGGFKFHRVLSTDPALRNYLSIADLAFIYAHGEYGEDGRIQGWLDYISLRYPGPGISASAICCDKLHFKHIVKGAALSTPEFFEITSSDGVNGIAGKSELLGYPLMMKHRKGGSSLGITLVENREQLDAWITSTPAAEYSEYFGEEFIDGEFITVGIIKLKGGYYILPYLRAETAAKYYDADTKLGTKNVSVTFTLSEGLSEELAGKLEKLSSDAFLATGCEGIARVDVMLKGDDLYLLEINTIPGISPNSNFTRMFTSFGFSYEELITAVMNTAYIKKTNKFYGDKNGLSAVSEPELASGTA